MSNDCVYLPSRFETDQTEKRDWKYVVLARESRVLSRSDAPGSPEHSLVCLSCPVSQWRLSGVAVLVPDVGCFVVSYYFRCP